jgi:hypothetical protein
MPYYLRAIYNMLDWHNPDYSSWLRENELPSCIVKDLNADNNALSLWEISNSKSNLLDIIVAIVSKSSNRSLKTDFDYALISSNHLNNIMFTPKKVSGGTPYTLFNHYHRDIPNLSLNQVVAFAYLLSKHGIFDRMGWKDIKNRLQEAYDKGLLNDHLKKGIKEQLVTHK